MSNTDLEVKVCDHCQHLNNAEEWRCTHCNAMFPMVTTRITIDDRKPSHSLLDLTPIPGKVILYIPSQETPVILPTKSRMKVGRLQPDNPSVDIDLAPFSAQDLGVSRIHALLTFSEKGTFLEDVGSSNGTWLNENRLAFFKPYPVQNGDLMRFGNLMVYIYFSDQQAITSTPRLSANEPLSSLPGPYKLLKPPSNELLSQSTIVEPKQRHYLELSLRHILTTLIDGQN